MSAQDVKLPEYAIHDEIQVDPKTTALIVVDMQNDFCQPDGTLFIEEAPKTFDAIAHLLAVARESGMPVFFTQDWHSEDDPEFQIWGPHARANTWGAEIVDALAPKEGEEIIRKVRYDAFYGTHLDHLLKLKGIETVIICGTVANICVHYTAASAALRWYRVIVPVDAISAITPFDKVSTCHQVTSLFTGRLTRAHGIRTS